MIRVSYVKLTYMCHAVLFMVVGLASEKILSENISLNFNYTGNLILRHMFSYDQGRIQKLLVGGSGVWRLSPRAEPLVGKDENHES